MSRTLIYVHGHGHKPPAPALEAIWTEALRAGIERDCPDLAPAFDEATRVVAYYGDLNNAQLAGKRTGNDYDAELDIADRRNAIARLRKVPKSKKFNRFAYEQVPGKSALAEFVADIGAPLLGKTKLITPVIDRLMPELTAYWDRSGEFYRTVSQRVLETLCEAMRRGDRIMVLAHGIGGIVAYDALWLLSQGAGDLGEYRDAKVERFVTLGTPLGNDAVRARLAGADEQPANRHPRNVLNWYNLAAEDDYVCHDKTLADDFRAMLEQRIVSLIEDYRVYNLAVRYGKSNPHSAVGYLIHPRATRLLAEWFGTSGT